MSVRLTYQCFAGQDASVVNQVTRGGVVRTVEHQVIAGDQFGGVPIVDLDAVRRNLKIIARTGTRPYEAPST